MNPVFYKIMGNNKKKSEGRVFHHKEYGGDSGGWGAWVKVQNQIVLIWRMVLTREVEIVQLNFFWYFKKRIQMYFPNVVS